MWLSIIGDNFFTLIFADPGKDLCVVTGLPAKYRDPKSGLPYATKEAFKVIRQQLSDKTGGISNKEPMGLLTDTIPMKKRRTATRKSTSSDSRPFARFLRFPPVEDEESE